MSQALQRIEQTREALIDALAARNWDAIGELDSACRECVDEVLSEAPVDEEALRTHLESLLAVYKDLLTVTMGERQAIVDEMSQINQRRVPQRFTICLVNYFLLNPCLLRHKFDCERFFDFTSGCFQISGVYRH